MKAEVILFEARPSGRHDGPPLFYGYEIAIDGYVTFDSEHLGSYEEAIEDAKYQLDEMGIFEYELVGGGW